jgi:hypothetical protein
MPTIRAGRLDDLRPPMGQWVFADPGFAGEGRKSCGLLLDSGIPTVHTFAGLREQLVALALESGPPLHLVIEAPLSVSFTARGNPAGRSVELRDGQSRYWYVGLGCSVLTSATYLVRAITNAGPRREIRLFEGLVSFKPKGIRSSHTRDVLLLRRVVRGDLAVGQIIAPEALAAAPDHVVRSAFEVAGMDYGVPPVVVGNTLEEALPH